MGRFSASLKVPGDRSALAATLLVEDGRLRIKAGDQPIGDWPLKEINLNRLDGGYRMTAEGEQLLIEVNDLAGFDEAVGQNRSKKLIGRNRSKASKTLAPSETPPPKKVQQESSSRLEGIAGLADGLIDRAERRWGALLPAWVFSRATVMGLVIILLITIFLPGLISSILLVAGLATVVFGAVLYTDDRMAAKVLPGRSTPTHVLIGGVGLLVLGVLVGVIAG